MSEQGTLLVGGVWESRSSVIEVTNPADGTSVGSVAAGSADDASRAADAAAAAFSQWSSLTPRRRSDHLRETADLIRQRARELAVLLAREAGKRLPEARAEIEFSAEYFQWFAEEVRRPTGNVLSHEPDDRRHLTLRRPAGVVASLTPWNFPCSIQARKLAPALAAGCTVVARVSDRTPLAATEMIRCLTDAGVPAGVVNLVHGPARQQTEALLRHPAVRVMTFTGSTEVGRAPMAVAADRIVRPLLELGGDAPFIVLADADVDAAVDGALLAKFRNTGQSCIAANRFIVHETVYDQFVEGLVAKVDAMSIGNGLSEPCPDLGPIIDDQRASAVAGVVDKAIDRGANLLTRRFDLPTGGSFAAPALLDNVPDGVTLSCDEVFGPVAPVYRVASTEEAVARANSTEMGLAGYLWSKNISSCWRIAEELQVGICGINNALPSVAFAPMGGVKQSGLGREGADLGIEEFQDLRYLVPRRLTVSIAAVSTGPPSHHLSTARCWKEHQHPRLPVASVLAGDRVVKHGQVASAGGDAPQGRLRTVRGGCQPRS